MVGARRPTALVDGKAKRERFEMGSCFSANGPKGVQQVSEIVQREMDPHPGPSPAQRKMDETRNEATI